MLAGDTSDAPSAYSASSAVIFSIVNRQIKNPKSVRFTSTPTYIYLHKNHRCTGNSRKVRLADAGAPTGASFRSVPLRSELPPCFERSRICFRVSMHAIKQINWIRLALFTFVQIVVCYTSWSLVLSFRSFRSGFPIGTSPTQMVAIIIPTVFGCALGVALLEAKLKRSLLKYYTILIILIAGTLIWIASGPSGHFKNASDPTEQRSKVRVLRACFKIHPSAA